MSNDRYLPTLSKARRVLTKQAVGAICVERTRGKTRLVEFGCAVSVHLFEGHASHQFQTHRNGRERLWHSHGCLTAARSNALRRHLAACTGAQARPGPAPTPGPSSATSQKPPSPHAHPPTS